MNTLLAATDLSKASKRAIEFAAQIASDTGAHLVIIHSVHPVLNPLVFPAETSTLADLKNKANTRLKKLVSQLQEKYTGLRAEPLCVLGLAADDIIYYAKKLKAGLIVVGMRRDIGVSDKLFGTVTTSLVRQSKTPVLCIHEKQEYRKIKRIVFATDFSHLEDQSILKELRRIAGYFDAEILVLHVFRNPNEQPGFEKAYEGLKIENALKGSRHSFHAITDSDVVRGITNFAIEQGADMVAMIPHDKPFLEKLFTRSASRKMALRSNTPLLTINDL